MKFAKKNMASLLCAISLSLLSFCTTVSAANTSPSPSANPLPTMPPPQVTGVINKILLGDVDGNGVINAIDFAQYRLYLLGKLDYLPLNLGDINKSGSIDAVDFAIVRKYILGMATPICEVVTPSSTTPVVTPGPNTKVDDWKYSPYTSYDNTWPSPGISIGLAGGGSSYTSMPAAPNMSRPMATSPMSSGTIGFSTGGAKDVNNFRENIKNNYFPQYSSLTSEGLFYDYYFDTGKQEVTDKLFSPSYTYAVSADPISKESEYYLSVGLNSGMKEEDFKRKKLNLTVVLDISGSMSSSFNSYYYDGKTVAEDVYDRNKNKLQIASQSIAGLLGHLNDDDRFGMVLYDDNAYIAKPLNLVGETNMDAIKNHILELTPQGGTYFEAGYKTGTSLYDVIEDYNADEYENRIIFLTDAMPNIGATSEDSLLNLVKKNAENKIYTTFIGIGVDFNTDLIDYITKTRGANYYSVNSSKEFKTRMDDEFEYMVTPLVFNLQLKLESKGFQIEKVYGSPEANEATGELMKVNTLFPAKSSGGETKGGIVLLKLKKISDDTKLTLSTSYEDRNGKADSDTVSVTFEDKKPDFYQNTGIRKGIILSRYVNLLKYWLANEAVKTTPNLPEPLPIVILDDRTGILVPDDLVFLPLLNKWEHQSTPLTVSQEYKDLFKKFIPYFESEIKAIGDETMSQEVDLLKKLCNYEGK